ncbi:uncharacterized protein LOC129906192 [Episyrphus balteatus]|uniref:uncharacterized protein LOC129906192 n=1 Tax=Episyrphus balteatus TaxID=286459 RepID=UPI002486CCCE|nr:uncharacterized protein LOC129906192 [Episyrphus balteatus]
MSDKFNHLKYFVTILLCLEILAGSILLCIITYFYFVLIAFLAKPERQLLLSQMTNIFVLGLEVAICFSIELILWQCICKSDTTSEHSRLLILWNIFCILAVGFGSVTMWFQYDNIQSLQKVYAESLFQGIDLYFTDPEWKLLWDRIQFNNECCGVFGVKDWEEAAWIREEQDDCTQKSELMHRMVMIPYACCKRSSISCFESFAPHSTLDKDNYKDLSNINVGGCFQKFQSLTLQFSYVVSCAWIAILVTYKYPRNVRCITLKDEDSFGDEQEEEVIECKPRCSNCQQIGASFRQDIFGTCNSNQNIFIH